ncbi:gas vesicle protein [Streptomyces spinoverrucosus]|uniref:gas vesicle protein n=1 Tax=Streptomyces spinoverrucosus TaxID=284043 RepID=UPI0018C4014A|nr:gas vesicle protein [Streptomyces spinoverrucosus]MBG0855288.1 gas vesicle protein [Streptomyces spinoverrucosus]
MTEPLSAGPSPARTLQPYGQGSSANLADILERVLDKGIVIVGDIKIDLLDIELLTIRLRLLVASVDKAKEIGIDWWERDPSLSSRADGTRDLEEQNARLRDEVRQLRRQMAELPEGAPTGRRRSRDRDPDREREGEREREPGAEPRRRKRRPDEDDDSRS